VGQPVLCYVPMKRRDVFAGLAFAVAGAAPAQQQAESLYIPKPHLVEDRTLLHNFMDEYAFVDVVTASNSIRITHIPVLLDRSAGQYGTLYGHLSRNNPQSQTFNGRQGAVIVFRGPHSYISPTWYAKTEAVPTWNFAVVHASGRPKPITDKKQLHDLLARLIKKFEDRYGQGSYDFSALPDSYISGMLGGIVGFEMPIESLAGKFKLGQERSEADKAGILQHLDGANHDRSLRELTADFYDRVK
jgi:transcriptional regulator